MFVIGHKTPNRREIGKILYYGDDADEANKAVAENADKFARIDISLQGIEAFFRTVQHYDPDHPSLKKKPVPPEPKPEPEPEKAESKSKK
jgi:hypothetical protein